MLGETIPGLALIGIAITLAGVVMVILESDERMGESKVSDGRKWFGVLCGLVGAIGQGVGLVLAKKGIYLNSAVVLNPISATMMRLLLGAVFIWALVILAGKLPNILQAARNREGMKNTIAASFVGPYLGITLSMVAVTFTETGIAQTLLSLMPVMIIPVVWIVHGQRTNLRGIVGAVVAVIGVAIIFIS
jgi:drug/metabolite transporter (DMT)-like permease